MTSQSIFVRVAITPVNILEMSVGAGGKKASEKGLQIYVHTIQIIVRGRSLLDHDDDAVCTSSHPNQGLFLGHFFEDFWSHSPHHSPMSQTTNTGILSSIFVFTVS